MLLIFILFFSLSSFSIDFYPIENLKEGMVGEVKTCLKGTNLQVYPIEIKGVLKGTTEKDFIILGKILGPEFEKTGIIAGMSGSPVYIEGKLLGAIAYAWRFSKEPLCGITYWKNMLELKAEGKKNFNYLKNEDLNLPFEDLSLKLKNDFEKIIKNLNDLKIQGYPFKENNLSIFEGGIVEKNIIYPIEGGYPIAGMLSWGDFNLFASGTITFKDKETIYAFGHPFLDLGKIEMPFARAYPELVVPSLSNSFRLSNGGEIIGTIEIDGKDGVIGKIGKMPKGIKIKVFFKEKEKEFFSIDHPLLLPVLSAIGTSFLFYDEYLNSGSGSISMEVKINGKDEIKSTFLFESEDLFSEIFSRISALAGIFSLNPFKKFEINLIEIKFKEIKEKNKFNITNVWTDKRKISKEKEIFLNILLNDYYGKEEKIIEKITLPNIEKNFEIIIGGGKEIEKFLRKDRIFTFKNIEELKKTIKEKPKDGFLNIYLKTQDLSILTSPYSFEKFSPSLFAKFPENKKNNYYIYKLKEILLPYPVEGFEEIKIEVEK